MRLAKQYAESVQIIIKQMEAIREIQTVEKGHVNIRLPRQFWGQQVEIIVLSMTQRDEGALAKKSLGGCLHQYANAAFIDREHEAWQNAVNEKYGDC
jgi:hypothetical protein